MQAMVLHRTRREGGGELVLEERAIPVPAGREVLVRALACGVCHTDLHIVDGDLDLPRLPLVPGHQVIGVVESAGPDARHVGPGQRVGVAWLHRACGRCAYCRQDKENLCPNASFTGFDTDGGYAGYLTADEDFIYPVPGDIDPAHAAPLLCAGVIGYRALRQAEVKPGEAVGLYGFGASAHIAIQIARFWRCRVHVFSRSEEHRAHARELGAVWAGSAEEAPPEKLAASVVFAPVGAVVPHALEHLDRGGTVSLAGITMSEIPPLDYERHLYEERTLRSVTAATRSDAEDLLDFAVRIPIHTDVETMRLEDANHALARMRQSVIRGAAVLDFR